MSKSTKLKPCPFCGREPALQVDKRYPKWTKDSAMPVDGYTVICNTRECPIYHADNTWFFRKEDAVIAWNERKGQMIDKLDFSMIPSKTLYSFLHKITDEIEKRDGVYETK